MFNPVSQPEARTDEASEAALNALSVPLVSPANM